MSRIIFAVLLLVTFAVFAWTLTRFVRFMMKGRPFEGDCDEKVKL